MLSALVKYVINRLICLILATQKLSYDLFTIDVQRLILHVCESPDWPSRLRNARFNIWSSRFEFVAYFLLSYIHWGIAWYVCACGNLIKILWCIRAPYAI